MVFLPVVLSIVGPNANSKISEENGSSTSSTVVERASSVSEDSDKEMQTPDFQVITPEKKAEGMNYI